MTARRSEGERVVTMKILITVLMTWLSVNFDLPAVQEQPQVKLVTQQEMASVRYGAAATANQAENLVAIFDDRTRTIYLAHTWTGSTPAEVSVLVHELVHFLQSTGNKRYPCLGAREVLAYSAQERWLGQFGRTLMQEFAIDPMTLMLRTSCM
jgi:hypothetical protein